VYKETGGVAPDQGDAMFSEIKSAVNGYRNYMRDQNLFWDATGDMSWLDMLKFVYNGSAVSVTYTDVDGASRTIGNAGTYSTWTSTQILNSYMFNYQLNTGTVRLLSAFSMIMLFFFIYLLYITIMKLRFISKFSHALFAYVLFSTHPLRTSGVSIRWQRRVDWRSQL
jgi:hypothetical protein